MKRGRGRAALVAAGVLKAAREPETVRAIDLTELPPAPLTHVLDQVRMER